MGIPRWTALGLVWICVVALGIATSAVYWAMVDKVNTQLPKDQQFSHAGWWIGKTLRLHGEYRRLFPLGNLLRKAGTYNLLMSSCVALATALLEFPLPIVAFLIVGGGFLTWAVYFRTSS